MLILTPYFLFSLEHPTVLKPITMSQYSLTSPPLSKFQLYLDNSQQERELGEETSLSCCSSFETRLDINMAPILFLRSVTASIAVSDFSVSDLALALTTKDQIEVQCLTDISMLQGNRVFNKSAVETLNSEIFRIPLTNVLA